MIRAGAAAAIAVLVSLTVPAEACWNRDGMGWRSASAGYGYREGGGYRSYRPWIGAAYGWRGDRYAWRHHRHWQGDRYGDRTGVAVGVRTGERWDGGRRWGGHGYGWRGDRAEVGMHRSRHVEAEAVTK